MTNKTEIKPCPFCGGAFNEESVTDNCSCSECGAAAWSVTNWQRRAEPPAPSSEKIECYFDLDKEAKNAYYKTADSSHVQPIINMAIRYAEHRCAGLISEINRLRDLLDIDRDKNDALYIANASFAKMIAYLATDNKRLREALGNAVETLRYIGKHYCVFKEVAEKEINEWAALAQSDGKAGE